MDEIHIYLWGRVQGVFFRKAAKTVADKLQLCGYVCNKEDGSVEFCYQGIKEQADGILRSIQKANPLIRIDRKEIKVLPIKEPFSTFSIIY